MTQSTLLLLAHEALCGFLMYSCFCRLVRTDEDTLPQIRAAFCLLAVSTSLLAVAPVAGWLVENIPSAGVPPLLAADVVDVPTLVLLAAVCATQAVTAHYWRPTVPAPFRRSTHQQPTAGGPNNGKPKDQ